MNIKNNLVLPGAIAGATLLGAASTFLVSALPATAATTATTGTSSTASSQATPAADPPDQSKGGHTANGITEVLLTGDTAAKVTAAAQAAVPGGTIERVENDAEGSAYEAHMTKSDGTHITVKLDSSFKVTSTDTDPAMPAAH